MVTYLAEHFKNRAHAETLVRTAFDVANRVQRAEEGMTTAQFLSGIGVHHPLDIDAARLGIQCQAGDSYVTLFDATFGRATGMQPLGMGNFRRVAGWFNNVETREVVKIQHVEAGRRQRFGLDACFTGNTSVPGIDGAKYTFRKLFTMQERGEALPLLASFDEAAQQIVYQQPVRVIRHDVNPAKSFRMARLRLQSDVTRSSAPWFLTTTPDHRFNVMESVRHAWEWATAQTIGGSIATGLVDLGAPMSAALRGLEGTYTARRYTQFAQSKHPLFDLTMPAPHHNYFVGDGTNFVLAHNKD